MKLSNYFFIAFAILIFAGIIAVSFKTCSKSDTDLNTATDSTTIVPDTLDLSKIYKITPAKFNNHDYILYEYGTRGTKGYSFNIEHSMECRACYDIFD